MEIKAYTVNGSERGGEGPATIEVEGEARYDEGVKSSAVQDWVKDSGSVKVGETVHIVGVGNVCYHIENRLDESASLG